MRCSWWLRYMLARPTVGMMSMRQTECFLSLACNEGNEPCGMKDLPYPLPTAQPKRIQRIQPTPPHAAKCRPGP
jgi:hypothetical protein